MSEDKNALDFNSLLAELDETTARLTSPPPSFVIPPTAPASGATATGSTATESNKATANTLGGYGTLRLDKGSASQVPPGTTGANTTTTSATTAAQQLKHGHLSNKSSVSSFKKSVSFDFGLDGAGYIEGEDERPASSSRRSSLGSSSAPSSILKIRVNPMHEVESKTPPLELEDYLLDEDEDFVTGEDDDTTDGYDTEDTEDDEDESTENEDNGVFRKKVVVDEDVESQVDEDLEFGDEDDLPLTVGGSPQSWSLAQFPPTNNPQTAAANTTNSNGDANSDPAMSRLQLSFEEATLEDYEDMDGLLDMLDKYLNRNSKAGHQLGGSPDVRRVVSERKDVGATPLMGLYEVPLATEGSRAEIGSVKLPPPPTSLPPSKVNSNNTQERSVAYPPTATTASPILASPSLKKESKKSSRNPTSTTNNPPTGLGSLPRNFTLPDGSDTDSEEGEVPTAPRSSSSNNKSSPLSGSSQVCSSDPPFCSNSPHGLQKQQRPAPVPAPRTSSHPKDATNTAPLKTSTPTNSSGPGAPPECGPSLAHHQQQQQQHQQRDSTKQSNDKANQILAKLHAANVKKVTTKLYIQDSRNSFTLSLTSLMTADYVIKALLRMSKLDESPVWTVFEMCNDDGLGKCLKRIDSLI